MALGCVYTALSLVGAAGQAPAWPWPQTDVWSERWHELMPEAVDVALMVLELYAEYAPVFTRARPPASAPWHATHPPPLGLLRWRETVSGELGMLLTQAQIWARQHAPAPTSSHAQHAKSDDALPATLYRPATGASRQGPTRYLLPM